MHDARARELNELFEALVATREGVPGAPSDALEIFLRIFPEFSSNVRAAALVAHSRMKGRQP